MKEVAGEICLPRYQAIYVYFKYSVDEDTFVKYLKSIEWL